MAPQAAHAHGSGMWSQQACRDGWASCSAAVTLVVIALVGWPCGIARGQSPHDGPHPTEPVTFEQALALARAAPQANASRKQLESRRLHDDGIGGTGQGTSLTVMPGAVVAPGPERGFELQVNLTQGISLGDLGGARRQAAGQERQVLSARVRAEALRSRLEAARHWVALASLQALATELDAQREVLEAGVARAQRALDAGVGSAAAVAEARAELAELGQRFLAVEGERFEAASQLAVEMGRADSEQLYAEGPLPAPVLPSLDDAQALLSDVEALPEVQVQRLAIDAARAREIEARAQYAPVLSVGAQLERSTGDVWVTYGVAGLSWNGARQSQRALSQARAETTQAQAEIEVTRMRARAEVARTLHEVEHTRRELAALEERVLPSLMEVVARRERALAAGEQTVFAVLQARHRLLEAREARVRSLGAQTWAELRLWLLLAELERGSDT